LTDADYEWIRQKGRQGHSKVEINEISNFMIVTADGRNCDTQLVRKIHANCKEVHEWPCHTIYGNRLYRCSRVHTLDRYLNRLGVAHEDFTADDGLLIENDEGLLARIRNYLECEEPLNACHFCYGTSGASFAHRQLTVDEIRAKRAGADLQGFNPAKLDFDSGWNPTAQ